MPDAETDTELAAETFKNTVRLKNKLINELKEKHGVDPRDYFPEGNFQACEEAVGWLLAQNNPDAAVLDCKRNQEVSSTPVGVQEIFGDILEASTRQGNAHRVRFSSSNSTG